jgi:hypothetical protein
MREMSWAKTYLKVLLAVPDYLLWSNLALLRIQDFIPPDEPAGNWQDIIRRAKNDFIYRLR